MRKISATTPSSILFALQQKAIWRPSRKKRSFININRHKKSRRSKTMAAEWAGIVNFCAMCF